MPFSVRSVDSTRFYLSFVSLPLSRLQPKNGRLDISGNLWNRLSFTIFLKDLDICISQSSKGNIACEYWIKLLLDGMLTHIETYEQFTLNQSSLSQARRRETGPIRAAAISVSGGLQFELPEAPELMS